MASAGIDRTDNLPANDDSVRFFNTCRPVTFIGGEISVGRTDVPFWDSRSSGTGETEIRIGHYSNKLLFT